MHPSLRLSNLSKLPSALRKRATAAASGSQGEFLKLAEELRAALIPPEHSALLLPAFYATLGTAEIPLVLEQLDTTSMQIETIRVRIVQVLGNLKMMAILGGLKSISTAAFVDLWLRVWPWIEFLDEYQDHLPGIEHFSQTERYSVYLALLLLFRREDETSVLMDSMAGPYAILGKAWSHFVHRYEEDAAHLQDVCLFLSFSRVLWGDARGQDPTIPFEGLITGAGGTRTDFASLVVSHLIRIVTDPPFVGTAAIILVLPQEGRDPSLRDALLAQGIVRALTTAALAFSSGPSDVRATVLKGILTSLVNYLGCFPRHRWFTESLRAGLLGVVFSSPHLPKSGDFLRALLRPGGVLPRSTVYHSVLSQPRLSLLEVRDRNAAAAFGDPEILEHWVHFLGLAEKRFQLVDLYHAGSSNAMRACDNLKCAKIEKKADFKRCDRCLRAYYCSQTCQTEDWRLGMHRGWCGVIPRAVARHRDVEVSAKDRSFFRALLHHDYMTRREEIALKQLLPLKMNPSGAPHTLFDYTAGTCGEINLADYQGDDSHYDGDAARLVASGGRMELHFMAIFNGREEAQIWKFPLHFASTEFFREMRAIAATVPPNATPTDLELYRPMVQDLLNLNVLATH